jgi:Zinc dependent phospholipase C
VCLHGELEALGVAIAGIAAVPCEHFESRPRASDRIHPRGVLWALILIAWLTGEQAVHGYSVLAHEGMVDAAWDTGMVPLLRQRFGRLTTDQLREARAYAYGGSLIQDLGYYPFGSHLLTNLTHYVRSGDFVKALIADATDANEYAFALGALAHYNSDCAGHPLAVNRTVPLMYPKVRAKVGPEALYVDSPARHIMVEFAFDVLQVAHGAYAAQAYHDRIGFRVSKPLLERAVRETYSLELADLLSNVDLAIGTYRRAVGTTIPELTRIAWREKRDEIEERTPGTTEQAFVFALSTRDYEQQFGKDYRKPGLLARVLAFVLKILPKVGPMRPLAFEPLTPQAERLFVESVVAARARYRNALQSLRAGRLTLPNTDFDTGRPVAAGQNRLADETYADLLHRLAARKFAGVSPQLQRDLSEYFAAGSASEQQLSRSKAARLRGDLDALNRRAARITRQSASESHRRAGSL